MALAAAMPAGAGVFVVTNSLDTTEVTSLRGAIIAANAAGGDNTILLENRLYHLNRYGPFENSGATGDLDITNGRLAIMGAASSPVVIAAADLGDRIFQVMPGAQLTLSGLLLTGGAAPGDASGVMRDGESGGAVLSQGTLLMQQCIVSNNASGGGNQPMGNGGGTAGGSGGGICSSGWLSMIDCVVLQNTAGNGRDGSRGGDGGGLCLAGAGVLMRCVITGNASGSGGGAVGNALGAGGGGGGGGGVFNAGSLTMIGCVVDGNATGEGASGGQPGIANGSSGGGWGGGGGSGAGLYNVGKLAMNGCAINGNACGPGGSGGQAVGFLGRGGSAGDGGSGGGIFNLGDAGLTSCIVARNRCGNGGGGGLGFGGGSSEGGLGGAGGGVWNKGALSAVACTIVANATGHGGNGGDAEDFFIWSASPAAGGAGGGGGGLLNLSAIRKAVIRNTLIALNSAGEGGRGGTNSSGAIGLAGISSPDHDGSGSFESAGFNLLGTATGAAGLTNGFHGDLMGSNEDRLDPRLTLLPAIDGQPLASAFLLGSPAIDAGDDGLLEAPENLAVDLRGSPRKSGAHVDIGAFEYEGTVGGIVQPPLLTGFEMTDYGLGFWFNGAPGFNYSLWASSDLSTWENLGAASETTRGWFECLDGDAMNHSRRFYRVQHP